MPVTPDDKMGMPIEDMVFWAVRCVKRVESWITMPPEALEEPAARALMDKESEFVRAYRTALTLRANEVVSLCERMGITGCTADKVRDNPFLIVMAIDRIINGDNQ